MEKMIGGADDTEYFIQQFVLRQKQLWILC